MCGQVLCLLKKERFTVYVNMGFKIFIIYVLSVLIIFVCS